MQNLNHKNIIKIKKYRKLSLKNISQNILKKLHYFMLKLRNIEEALSKEYHPADQMKCPVHFCAGQEAAPVALKILLNKDDYLFSHHRSHGYYLAKNAPVEKLFAEIYGKKTGANSGIAGSQDISYPKKNFYSGAILSGSVSIAIGAAMSLKMRKDNKKIIVAGFGEAATDEGIFWESINYAALDNLPIIFICENNNYSVFSPQPKRQSGKSISKKAQSFGVQSKKIFGNDVCLVYKELKKAVKKARNKKGPFLLETITYRYNGHVGPLSDDLIGYRSQKELKFWEQNCPIKLLEEKMLKNKILNTKKIEKLKNLINKEIEKAFKFAKDSDFPSIKSFDDLNLSKSSPVADKILTDLEKTNFNEDQKVIQIKGY